MDTIHQEIRVSFSYDVHFTEDVFELKNELLAEILLSGSDPVPRHVLAVIDDGLLEHYPSLPQRIQSYLEAAAGVESTRRPVVVPGGEAAKNDPALVARLHRAIAESALCRHSYVIAVGGGSVIDLAGYAAATAHRGIRLIRVPTTVLGQNDSAVGVKNGVNRFNAKNFLGTFAPPFAVINDLTFLKTLEDRDWRSGISEAVKVALLKDAAFFEELEASAEQLSPAQRNIDVMRHLIRRCAELHLEHIATSGDPFEMGSSRPLDFGHWAAHQLEKLTNYDLRHGEAVAIGIALDATYSHLSGMLAEQSWRRIVELFERVGFELYAPELDDHLKDPDHPRSIFQGLEAFREHLGGELTIMLLGGIGQGMEVHSVDHSTYREAVSILRNRYRPASMPTEIRKNVA